MSDAASYAEIQLSPAIRREQLRAWAFGTLKSFRFTCDEINICVPDMSCCDEAYYVEDAEYRWTQYQMRYPHPQLKHCTAKTRQRLHDEAKKRASRLGQGTRVE